jgi:hypothetical protein
VADVVFQFNPRVSNDVAWLSCNPSLLPVSNNICSWHSASLILFLLVDLVPGPTLNLSDGADGAYQSVCFLSRLSIDEIIGRRPLTCISSKPVNINRCAVVICDITRLPAVTEVLW